MTINVQINTLVGAPGILAVNYFKNANVLAPRLLSAGEYRIDNLVDPVNGERIQIRLISNANDLTYTGNVVTGGTIDEIHFYGGPTVNGLINPITLGATVTGYSIDANSLYKAMLADDLAALDMLLFQAGDFLYTGNIGNDTFTAGNSGDVLGGGGGKDTLNGREGDDTISGGAANDTLDGGAGIDTLDYSYLIGGQNLTLTLGAYDSKTGNVAASSTSGVAGDVDSVKNFENVIGGDGNDKLTGNAFGNILQGNSGNDTLIGLGGADVLDGGNGLDTVSYASSTAGVTVNLNNQGTYNNDDPADGRLLAGNAQQGGDAAGDLLWSIESVIGSAKDDVLTAKNADDTTQFIDAGAGNDFVYASKHGETLLGGAGIDTLSFAQVTTGIQVNLANQGAANATRTGVTGGVSNGQIAVNYNAAEFENLIGGDGDDVLTGDRFNNIIEGGKGADQLVGGLGVDTLSYAGSAAGVTVVLSLQGTSNADGSKNGAVVLPLWGGDAEGDEIWGFENLLGSAKNDYLEGDDKANTIQGGDGDDAICGAGGNDALDGGAGFDIVSFDYLVSGKNLTLTLGAYDSKTGNTAQTSTSGVSGDVDTIKNIEGISGGTGNDKLTGNAADNALYGGSGADILAGLGGADILDGGGGIDTITYLASAAAVTIDLSLNNDGNVLASGKQKGGDAEGDRLANVDILIGSSKNDILVGVADGDDITIDGGAGDDVIGGQSALSYVIGGVGNDTVHYGDVFGNGNTNGIDQAVTVDLQRQLTFKADYTPIFAAGKSEIHYWQFGGNADGSLLSGIENIIGGDGDDVLTGDKNVNILEGGKGADTLTGIGAGDKVSYAGSSMGVYVNLENAFQDGVTAQSDKYSDDVTANGDAAGDILFNLNTFIGSKFDDVVQGNSLKIDMLFGGDGNDDLSGGGGKFADYLDGGAGDDNLYGGDGGDTLIGGDGIDWAAYGDGDGKYTVGITITLGKNGTATGFSASGGEATGDKLTGIENISATQYADTLTGNELDNTLYGWGGNDKIAGMGGADFLDGNKGIDTVDYSASKEGVTVSLAQQGTYIGGNPDDGIDDTTGFAQTGGDAQGDKLWGFENVIGSAKNDTLTGDHNVNVIDGGAGDDFINGNDGADILVGGAGVDTVSYATSGAVSVSLLKQGTYNATTGKFTGQAQAGAGGDAEGDMLSGFENIVGSSGNDTLIGDNNANVIEGGAGADTLVGLGGIDTVSYASSNSAVTVKLWGPYQGKTDAAGIPVLGFESLKQEGGHALDDQLYGFENIIGSIYDDKLEAGDNGSSLWGGAGNDFLTGMLNNKADKLYGGDGDDVLFGYGGADTLDGGDGIDTVYFSFVFTGAGATIALSNKAGTAATVSGAAAGTRIIDVENIVGTGQGDKLTGNDTANELRGLAGDDTLSGLAGNDILEGGANNDTLIGGDGEDILDGGTGNFDRVDYSASKSAVTINMSQQGTYVNDDPDDDRDVAPVKQSGGDAQGDQFWSIEWVVGSAFNDVLKGAATNGYVLDGGKGDDLIIAGAGLEVLVGGDNTAVGDTVSYLLSNAAVNVNLLLQGTYNATTGALTGTSPQSGGYAQGDYLIGFENVIGSIYADTIRGDAKNNVIEGDDGGDTMFGGAGIDTVSYKGSVFQVTVDLLLQGTTNANGSVKDAAMAQSGGAGHSLGDLLYDFENILGSDSATGDILYGDNNANVIDGGAGNDFIYGRGGNDTLRGGEGDDTFYAGGANGAGADTLDGGAGFDIADYSGETAGVTVMLGVNGASASVSGGPSAAGDKLISIEHVIGGSGNDKLTGNNLAHTLEGNGGNDTLTGGSGDSTLYGGSGDDTIFASVGVNETYDGGSGGETNGDTLTFANFAANTVVSVNLATSSGSVTGITNLTVSNFEQLVGGAGNDILIGNATTATKISGGAGNDRIQGGSGVDTFTGGAGNDTFVFIDAAQGKDVFTDFTSGDKLEISAAGFGGGLDYLPTGTLLEPTFFVVGAAPVVNNSGHGQFLYNTTNDTLYWDSDGVAGGEVAIGQFGSAVVLKLSDFTLV